MNNFSIFAWQPLMRPPLPDVEPPPVPPVPLKALACRNSVVSPAVLVVADERVDSATLVFSDLISNDGLLPGNAVRTWLIGAIPTAEAGPVCDALYEVDDFPVDKSAALYAAVTVPRNASAGVYRGTVKLIVAGCEVAVNDVEIEVANVVLPDVHDWDFFLNVWANPAALARRHGVDVWSDEHFRLMRPYIRDLAAHGQKTAVVPICHQPWGAQTRDPYPSAITWLKRGENYEFDFTVFDRYVTMHEEYGIDRAVHCYSIVQGPGGADVSVIEYVDADSGRREQIETHVGDQDYTRAWSAFFKAFQDHLTEKGWMNKAYIAFDEKPPEVMGRLIAFMAAYAPEFRISLASNTGSFGSQAIDDLSLAIPFDERGVAENVPPARSALGVVELLDPHNYCSVTKKCPEKTITTFYVCCGPEHPNTFVHSPLVESRMLPYLALQGGFDGFLRWAYNDWSDEPYTKPGWGEWPTGDTFLVYPGDAGPVSSLRWEQLREGIQDYELAMIASANIQTPEEMVDYEQAITLACRNVDGRMKSTGDIEIARRLLIPIAAHQNE